MSPRPAAMSVSVVLLFALLAPSAHAFRHRTHEARLSWGDRSFASSVRRELDAPRHGAPAIETITSSQVSIGRIQPLQDALAYLEPASSHSVRAIAHANVADALARRQFDGEAAAEYLAAIEHDPTLVPAWNNLASLLRRHGKASLAKRAVGCVLHLEPRNGLAWFTLALLREDDKDLDGADEAYLKALTYQPSLWLPSQNPLIIGNGRAQLALLRSYMHHGGASGGITLDPNPTVVP